MATILHAVLGYLLLTLVMRALVRRPGAQMTLFEFVLVFLIGGVIILSTVGNDHSVTNCTCAVIAISLMHRLTSTLKLRYPALGRWVDGTPLVLVRHGVWQNSVLTGMRLAPEDVMAAARTKGIRRSEDIGYAILERNGGISILERQEGDEGA